MAWPPPIQERKGGWPLCCRIGASWHLVNPVFEHRPRPRPSPGPEQGPAPFPSPAAAWASGALWTQGYGLSVVNTGHILPGLPFLIEETNQRARLGLQRKLEELILINRTALPQPGPQKPPEALVH